MTAAYDDVAEEYRKALEGEPDDAVLEELIGDVAGQRVLALACGQGRDARMLARLGASVVGVDVSAEMLRFAREHEAESPQGIEYVEADARELHALGDAAVDGVVCHMALMDIPELAPAIREVGRVLSPGGWFVFSIVHPCFHPHVEIASEYLEEHRYDKLRPPEWLPRHAYHRPLSAYANELDVSGLALTRMREVHHPSGPGTGVPGLLYARAVKR